nr:hypothetical protein [Tanacetum cinerariifolium]
VANGVNIEQFSRLKMVKGHKKRGRKIKIRALNVQSLQAVEATVNGIKAIADLKDADFASYCASLINYEYAKMGT